MVKIYMNNTGRGNKMVKILTLIKEDDCKQCNGTGTLDSGQDCRKCNGKGKVNVEVLR